MRAVLFDLDGTLIDTEEHTELAIAAVMAEHGVAGFALPATLTHGCTWDSVAEEIRRRTHLDIGTAELAAELLEHWVAGAAGSKPIPGAPAAIRAAAASNLRLGVVSSSPRSVIDYFLDKLGVSAYVDARARIGAEAVRATKPDPEGFLLAARVLAVEPAECLVFEDSNAGLLAARAAHMRSIFITCRATDVGGNMGLATAAFEHYGVLPPRFWERLASGDIDLRNPAIA
ncbi:MAG TPA: HAD family phosphatase [Steroidobacteraceae bacterium]